MATSIFDLNPADQSAIERRQKIAAAMLQQGQEPMQTTDTAGGYIVPISPLSAIAKVTQALTGAWLGNQADKEHAKLLAARETALSNIDLSSEDAPNQLLKLGLPEQALAAKKAQLGNGVGNYLLGYDAKGNPIRFNKATGLGGAVPNETTGEPMLGSALYDPAAIAARERAKQLENIGKVELPSGETQIMPNYQAMGTTPVIGGIAQIESSGNPNAANPLPGSTSHGLYGFTAATRKDAGLPENASPEQETALMEQLHPARIQRYGGNEDLAILSHNIGITGADEVAQGRRQLTPENIAYIEKVKRGGPVIGQSPAQLAELTSNIELKQKKTEEQQKVAAELPKIIETTDYTAKLIDDLKTHPGLKWTVGAPSLAHLSLLPGTPAADFQTRLDQLQGQQFLNAYNTLKGGGQITEVEGKKATDALGRLSTKQSPEAFISSLDELKSVLENGKKLAIEKAGNAPVTNQMKATQSAATAPTEQKVINGKTYYKINGEWHE